MIDNRTQNLGIPMPHPDNDLEDDVPRLRQALENIDAAILEDRDRLARVYKDVENLLPASGLDGSEAIPAVRSTGQTVRLPASMLTSYQAVGAGAVPRQLADKAAEMPSVIDFGAHRLSEPGYSAFDSTGAFQRAGAAHARPVVPAGSYKITKDVAGTFIALGAVTIVGGGKATIKQGVIDQGDLDILRDDVVAASRNAALDIVSPMIAGAEAARDAAQLAAGVYPDTATGLAAVQEGKYFSIPSVENSEFLVLYRKVSGVAVEIKRYPGLNAFLHYFNDVDWNSTGYAYALVDLSRNILFGVREDGSFVCRLASDALPSIPADKLPTIPASKLPAPLAGVESGVYQVGQEELKDVAADDYGLFWALVDAARNLPLAVDLNGTVIAPRVRIAGNELTEDSSLGAGYIRAWADANGHLLFGVREDGSFVCRLASDALPSIPADKLPTIPASKLPAFDVTQLPSALQVLVTLANDEATAKDTELGAGFVKVIADAAGRVLYGVREDGSFVCQLAKDSLPIIPVDKLPSIPADKLPTIQATTAPVVATANYIFYTAADPGGIIQVMAQQRLTGKVAKLTAATKSSGNLAALDADTILYTRDAVGYYQNGPTWKEYVTLPKAAIACWGDSMTAGAGGNGTTYPGVLATLSGLSTYNGGVGGQGSTSIAIRQGGVGLALSVEGNTIPASGPVNVTAKSGTPVTSQGGGPMYGWLAGVYGYLSRIANANTAINDYTFTRAAAGGSVACPANSVFTVDTAGRDEHIACFWMGRNNPVPAATVVADVQSCVNFLKPLGKRFVVLSICNGNGETTGTTAYNNIKAANDALMAAFPDNFCDVRSAVVAAYDSNSAQDVIDHSGDTTPASLRVDGVHFTSAGYQIVATTVFNFIKEKGWV